MPNKLKIIIILCFYLINANYLFAQEDKMSEGFGEYVSAEASKATIHIIDNSSVLGGPKLRTAIAVSENFILTSDISTTGEYEVVVDNRKYPANYIASNETGNLLLFRVPNASLVKVPFALKRINSGRSIFIHHFDKSGEISDNSGSFQKKIKFNENTTTAFSHNLDDFLSKESIGAPLFNNCGEIIGINIKNKNKRPDLKANFIAIDHLSIINFLKTQDINFVKSLRECPSESEKRIIVEAENKEKELKANNAQKEKEQSDELLKIAQKEKEEAEKIKAEIEEKKAIQDDFNKNLIYAGSLSGIVLIILIFFLIRNNRRRSMELGVANETIAARDALQIDPGPNFILRGSELTIKIPGERLGLDQGVVLGRNTSEADVILDRSEISRTHLRFIMREDKVYADDLGSANGTILNGARLSAGRPMALHNKDEITLAGIIFIVEGL